MLKIESADRLIARVWFFGVTTGALVSMARLAGVEPFSFTFEWVVVAILWYLTTSLSLSAFEGNTAAVDPRQNP